MQCTSVYPAPAERINLRAMATMERAFERPRRPLATTRSGIAIPIAAAALGAAFVEKHFTLDRTMSGPDHPFAVEPDELRGDGRRDPRGPGRARRRPQGRPDRPRSARRCTRSGAAA